MKKKHALRLVLILYTALLLFTSCGKDEKPLIGTWTRQIDDRVCTFYFFAESHWQLEFYGGETIDIYGTASVSDDQIMFLDEGGKFMSNSAGVYTFTTTKNSLTFTVVNDPIEERKRVIKGTWTKN